jgi:hypothetical protein
MKYPKVGDYIYHKDVNDYKEKLFVVGIDTDTDNVKVRGDFSGGTQPFDQTNWLSFDGYSHIEDYRTKKYMRDFAVKIEIFTDPITKAETDKNNELLIAKNYILHLTREIVD